MPERSRHPFRLIADTKVGTRLLILVLGFLIWGAVGSLLAFQTLREVQVNGPIYARLVEGKDLIADILPPPRYIVEANLLAHELFLADAAEDKNDLEQRLRSLAQDYARRQTFWEQAGLETPLHQALVVKSHEPANLFFKVAFDAFMPALRAGDRDAAAKHLAVMNRDYKEHRKAILEVVRLAEARNQEAEEYATATLHRRIWVWVGVAAAMSILVVGFSLAVRRSIVGPLDDAVETVQSIAHGDLTHPVSKGHADEIGKLLDAVGTMQDNLRTLVGSVQRDAAFLAQASQEMSTATGESAAATTAQSEAVADMAASMEQMSVSIDQVEENARTAKATAARSGDQSRQGGEVIQAAVAEMRAITDSVNASALTIGELEGCASEISAIVGVIHDIADQTNLLALNAAIEAARAGEHGRGFAVVADEVRKLSERTTGSTRQIRETIEKVQKGARLAVASMESGVARVNEGMRTAALAGESIVGIQQSADQVVHVVQDIAVALEEQAEASRRIAGGVERIAQMAEENSNSVRHSADAAKQMQTLARTLTQSVGQFKS